MIYFRRAGLGNFHMNYSYGIADQCWEPLLRCPLGHPTLTIIDGQLTAIGDKNLSSNQLCTLQGRRHCQQWVTVYPPMPTRRGHSKWEYSFPSWLPAFYMRAGAHYH